MPTLIRKRSYYDHHETQGGMFPFDQIVDVAGNAVNAIGNVAANVGRVVTAPVRGVVNAAYLANEARHGLSSIAERFPGEQHAREGNRPDGRPYNFVGKLIA